MPSKLRQVSSHATAALAGAISSLVFITTREGATGTGKGSTYKPDDEIRSNTRTSIQGNPSSSNSAATTSAAVLLTSSDKEDKSQRIETYHSFNSLPSIQSPITIFQPNPNLQIAYDARTKNPVYAMEKICYKPKRIKNSSNDSIKDENYTNHNENDKRQHYNFYESKALSTHHRSRNSYYKHSGYDRGHLAPAADFNSDADHKLDTYSLINISPQHPNFNRKVWLRLEEWIRNLVTIYENDVYVISGPIWLPSNKYKRQQKQKNHEEDEQNHERDRFQYTFDGIGLPPSIVHVPTHFFKVIFTLSKDDKNNDGNDIIMSRIVDHFAAFVIPNDSFENRNNNNNNHNDDDDDDDDDRKDSLVIRNTKLLLSDCIVNIQDLEAVTGLSFFPLHYYDDQKNSEDTNYSPSNLFDTMTDFVRANYQHGHDQGEKKMKALVMIDNCNVYNLTPSKKRRWKKISKKFENEHGFLPKHFCFDRACDGIILHKTDDQKCYKSR